MKQNEFNAQSTSHLNMVMFLLDQSLSFICTTWQVKCLQGVEIYRVWNHTVWQVRVDTGCGDTWLWAVQGVESYRVWKYYDFVQGAHAVVSLRVISHQGIILQAISVSSVRDTQHTCRVQNTWTHDWLHVWRFVARHAKTKCFWGPTTAVLQNWYWLEGWQPSWAGQGYLGCVHMVWMQMAMTKSNA